MCSQLCARYAEKPTDSTKGASTGASTGPGTHGKCSALCAQHYVLSIMCSALCTQHYVLYIMCSAFPKKRYREWISKANNSDKMIALDFLAAKYLKSDESFDEVLSHLQVCRPHSHVCVHAHLYVSTCVCSLLCAHLILRTEEFVGHIPRPRPGQL